MPINSKGQFISAETMPLKDRFMAKVDKQSPYWAINTKNNCWLWTGYLNRGYGYMHIGLGKSKRPHPAYRISYQLFKGDIPKGLVVRHQCDRKDCVNPEHLLLGTQKDNMQDAIIDNTIPRGEHRHTSKLSEEDARDILFNHFPLPGQDWLYCIEKSKEYDVKPICIYNIIKRKSWIHL